MNTAHELRAENLALYAQLGAAGTRTKAILLANIDINNRKIAVLESVNVLTGHFGGRK